MRRQSFSSGDGSADFFFRCSLFLFPANAAVSVGAFGEIGSEPYLLVNLLTIIFLVFSGNLLSVWKSNIVGSSFLLFFIFLSFAGFFYNYESISVSVYKDKAGISRFFSGILIPLWGAFFSVLVFYFARKNFAKNIVSPLYLGGALVIVFAVFEIVSWQSDSVRSIYLPFTNVIHALMRRGESVIGRVQSITYEASNFGFYVCLIVPLFFCLSRIEEFRDCANKLNLMVFLLVILAFFSGRTSFAGVLLSLFFVVIFVRVAKNPKRFGFLAKSILSSIPAVIIFFPLFLMVFDGDFLISLVYDSDNQSNVSRYSTIYSQVEIFLDNIIVGVGLNQYGYYYPSYVPSWADNWETNAWIFDYEASFFPSFSLYSRVAAELGGVGVLFLYFVIQYIYTSCVRFVFDFNVSHDCRIICAAIAAGIVSLCFVLWTVGTFRIFNFWFLLGIFCYIKFRISHEGSAHCAVR